MGNFGKVFLSVAILLISNFAFAEISPGSLSTLTAALTIGITGGKALQGTNPVGIIFLGQMSDQGFAPVGPLCSGTLIDDQGYLLTASHCVKDMLLAGGKIGFPKPNMGLFVQFDGTLNPTAPLFHVARIYHQAPSPDLKKPFLMWKVAGQPEEIGPWFFEVIHDDAALFKLEPVSENKDLPPPAVLEVASSSDKNNEAIGFGKETHEALGGLFKQVTVGKRNELEILSEKKEVQSIVEMKTGENYVDGGDSGGFIGVRDGDKFVDHGIILQTEIKIEDGQEVRYGRYRAIDQELLAWIEKGKAVLSTPGEYAVYAPLNDLNAVAFEPTDRDIDFSLAKIFDYYKITKKDVPIKSVSRGGVNAAILSWSGVRENQPYHIDLMLVAPDLKSRDNFVKSASVSVSDISCLQKDKFSRAGLIQERRIVILTAQPKSSCFGN